MKFVNKNAELAERARQEMFAEACSGKKELRAIEETAKKEAYKKRDVSTKYDKTKIAKTKNIAELAKNESTIFLNVFTEAVSKYAIAALPVTNDYKVKLRGAVFASIKEQLEHKMNTEENFIENLRGKTNLLENIMDRVQECTRKVLIRSLKEGEGDEVTDPVSLLTSDEDNIISTDNTSTNAVPAEDIEEVIADKVIAVVEDENARAEEEEAIIADLKNAAKGTTVSETEISEAITITNGSLFSKFMNESQMGLISNKENLLESLTEDVSTQALAEAVIKYTIAETLYTLRIHEVTNIEKY